MPEDIAVETRSRPVPAAEQGERQSHWGLLGHLESAAIGERASDGSIRVRRGERAGCILFGPYLHLPEGRYRLSFRCRSRAPRLVAQPVLGVEIIVTSRFQQQWRDFTAAELEAGVGSLDFAVSSEHSIEGENQGRFEFRFFHLGNAGLRVTAVELERLPAEEVPAGEPRLWRMLGRLHKSWLGRRSGDGSVRVGRFGAAGVLLFGGWPYLRLPGGRYQLILRGRTTTPRRPGQAVLGVEVFGQSRWHSRRWLMLLARLPETNGVQQARREITAEEIDAGPVAVDFTVPAEIALEAGADAPFDIRLHHRGNQAFTIEAVDLLRLDDDRMPALPPPSLASAARRLGRPGRCRIVMIGNCQTETLRQGFARSDVLNKLFDVKYHFIHMPEKHLREFATTDIETCDILLVQDNHMWDEFPLRDCVRPGADIRRFPLIRFASLWPFDAWNGPGDRQAHDREAPNLTFPYLDGLLGRLRQAIPDKDARFEAYRSLSLPGSLPANLPGVINYRRLHQIEQRRLAAMDKEFGISIGSFILENFQNRRIFHTTVQPNWEVFSLLMKFVAKLVGVSEPISLNKGIDAGLRNPQVPIHPKVARDLGVKWADENTHYLDHGREITWERYIRSYIDHYG
jgi:hypothetical protein